MKIERQKCNKSHGNVSPNSQFSKLVNTDDSKKTLRFRFEKFEIDLPTTTITTMDIVPRTSMANFLVEEKETYRFSQVLDSMIYYYTTSQDQQSGILCESIHATARQPYIIPVAVQYNPHDWTDVANDGEIDTNKKSIFELLNPIYKKDMQKGRALLLIDQSVEGYGADWLWKWFHDKCKTYDINPAMIIYTTGDQSCEDQYSNWCKHNKPKHKIKVISSTSLSTYINRHFHQHIKSIDYDKVLKHKSRTAKKQYLFDCINMRPRVHRIYNYIHLINAGLTNYGNISMPAVDDWQPYIDLSQTESFKNVNISKEMLDKLTAKYTVQQFAKYKYNQDILEYHNYVERILTDMYKNSWVSLVTESTYFAHEHSVFISEKTFKPIATMQPFIILGSQHSLKYLKDLGYKTFEPFIDESYDNLDDGDRFLRIIDSLKKIQKIKDKVGWLKAMRPILEHNYQKFMEIGHVKSHEHLAIEEHYFKMKAIRAC